MVWKFFGTSKLCFVFGNRVIFEGKKSSQDWSRRPREQRMQRHTTIFKWKRKYLCSQWHKTSLSHCTISITSGVSSIASYACRVEILLSVEHIKSVHYVDCRQSKIDIAKNSSSLLLDRNFVRQFQCDFFLFGLLMLLSNAIKEEKKTPFEMATREWLLTYTPKPLHSLLFGIIVDFMEIIFLFLLQLSSSHWWKCNVNNAAASLHDGFFCA